MNAQELITDEVTSRRMARVRQKSTTPEIAVRRVVHRLGLRFRLENSDLPGSPDLANRSKQWVIFVHGCYWHHHEGCRLATIPKRNRQFWVDKFHANRARDARVIRELDDIGFDVVTIWECQTRSESIIEELVRRSFTLESSLDKTRHTRIGQV